MKKNNIKGFVLAEVIVISLVVISALTIIYTQFISVNNSYYRSFRYNTVDDLYAVDDIRNFIEKDSLDNIKSLLVGKNYLDLTGCSYEYFLEYNYCKTLLDTLNVKSLIFAYEDVTDLKSELNQIDTLSEGMKTFIKTISSDKNNKYRLIVEFEDDRYATLKIGSFVEGKSIVLKGDSNQTFNTQTAYVEEGYTVYDSEGNEITGNVVIDNPLTSVPYKAGTYEIKYSLLDINNELVEEVTRTVTITPSIYEITNLVTNGSFETGSYSLYSGYNYTVAIETETKKTGDYSLKLMPKDSTLKATYIYMNQLISFDPSHKYYYSLWYNVDTSGKDVGIYFMDRYYATTGEYTYVLKTIASVNEWEKISLYINKPDFSITNNLIRIDLYNRYTEAIGYFDDMLIVDLTETFGAGNEPTQEWCDENIEWFDGTTNIEY